ncbi:MAG: flagellar basal body rod protein FlgB [Lachnospiraceae bacterium]|nr:flagellar basal body rod protein FlgB [Lachnospiraceae bacterium]
MINSQAFDYINVMDRAADASYLRETVISNNISNVDTPQYKRQDVNFEDVLKNKLMEFGNGANTMDKRVAALNTDDLNAVQYVDAPMFSYRLDKNNVDIDTENVELASEQLRYQAITTSVSNDFSRLKAVLK